MEEERYRTGEVWGIPFVFDTMSLVDIDNVETIYNLQHLEDPNYPDELKNPLDFIKLFHSTYGVEQWGNIKRSLREIGRNTFADATEFYFESMQEAGRSEGADLKN